MGSVFGEVWFDWVGESIERNLPIALYLRKGGEGERDMYLASSLIYPNKSTNRSQKHSTMRDYSKVSDL